MNSERTILVTGFGPFDNHKVNASWEAVKELNELRDDLRERHNVKLIVAHVPVIYKHVQDTVSQLWGEYNPQIVLHVGVSHKAKCLTIENRAHGTGYIRRDINDECPTGKCEDASSIPLETGIDVEQLCRKINDDSSENSCKACVSQDAGRYLCEYIYYQSLCQDPKRTLFIHVPDFHVCSSKVIANGLYKIIELLVDSL